MITSKYSPRSVLSMWFIKSVFPIAAIGDVMENVSTESR